MLEKKKRLTWALLEVMCKEKERWVEDVMQVVALAVVLENGQ